MRYAPHDRRSKLVKMDRDTIKTLKDYELLGLVLDCLEHSSKYTQEDIHILNEELGRRLEEYAPILRSMT